MCNQNRSYVKKKVLSVEKKNNNSCINMKLYNFKYNKVKSNDRNRINCLQKENKTEKESLRKEFLDIFIIKQNEKKKLNKKEKINTISKNNNIKIINNNNLKKIKDNISSQNYNNSLLIQKINFSPPKKDILNSTNQNLSSINLEYRKSNYKIYEEKKNNYDEIDIDKDKFIIFDDDKKNYILEKDYSYCKKNNLTPIPKRFGPKENHYAEYDYNQAKSAAILVRRLEYSYNLRLTKIFNCYLKQIDFIKKKLLNKYLLKRDFLKFFKDLIDKIKKVKILQKAIKYFLLKKNENYLLKIAREYHPYLYYKIKYINNKTKQKIKIYNFELMKSKWIKFARLFKFIKKMKHIFLYQYFNSFIMKFARKTNTFLVYFLLKPLFKEIQFIYYKNMIGKGFLGLKAYSKKMKRNDILGFNLIKKCIKSICFIPFMKKFKFKKYINLFVRKVFIVLYRNIQFQNKKIFFILREISKNKLILNYNKRKNILKFLLLRNFKYNLISYFYNWKNVNLIEKKNIFSKNILINTVLKSILKNNIEKYKKKLIHYFYFWVIQMYKMINYQTKVYFFMNRIIEIKKKNIYLLIYDCFKNNENNTKIIKILKNVINKKELKENYLKNFYFQTMKVNLKKEKINYYSITINKYYKKKIVLKNKNNKLSLLKKILLKKESNVKKQYSIILFKWKKKNLFQKLLSSIKKIQKAYRKYKKSKKNL